MTFAIYRRPIWILFLILGLSLLSAGALALFFLFLLFARILVGRPGNLKVAIVGLSFALLSLFTPEGPETTHQTEGMLMGRIWVQASVEGPPSPRSDGWKIALHILQPTVRDVTLFGKGKMPSLARGETVQFSANFSPGKGGGGEGGRPTRFFATSARNLEVLSAGSWVWRISTTLRNRVYKRCSRAFSPRALRWVVALGMGDSSLLPSALKDRLNRLGISHLLAVSGLHLGLLFGLVWFALRYSSRWFSYGVGRWIRASLAFGSVGFYFLMTSQGPASSRAIVFALVGVLSILGGRRLDPFSLLGLAALVLMTSDKEIYLNPGFQLSFGAIVGFVLVRRIHRGNNDDALRFLKPKRTIFEKVEMTLLAPWIATLPLVAFWFGQIPWLAPFANGIAIPIASFILLPINLLFLLCGLAAPDIILDVCGTFGDWLAGPVEHGLIVLEVGFGKASQVDVGLGLTCFFLFGSYGLFFLRSPILRIVAMGILLGGLSWRANSTVNAPFQLTFLDVGHGDASVLHSGERTLVVDGGKEGAGWYTVLPWLRALPPGRRISLLLTHPDEDHLGGLFPLAERLEGIGEVYWSGVMDSSPRLHAFLATLTMRGIPIVEWQRGHVEPWGNGAFISVLSPRSIESPLGKGRNNDSLVFRFEFGRFVALFMGDLERAGEEDLRRSFPPTSVSLLKVGHHGSRTSSGDAFLEWCEPMWSVISNDPKRGHPHPVVSRRLREHSEHVFTTGREGSVTFQSDGETLWKL